MRGWRSLNLPAGLCSVFWAGLPAAQWVGLIPYFMAVLHPGGSEGVLAVSSKPGSKPLLVPALGTARKLALDTGVSSVLSAQPLPFPSVPSSSGVPGVLYAAPLGVLNGGFSGFLFLSFFF